MKTSTLAQGCAVLAFSAAALAGAVHAATPQELLADYRKQAAAAPEPERGQRLFNTEGKGDLNLSCASCHGSTPTRNGKHAISEKTITPLAPAFNAERFTDKSKVERYFRLNCMEVLARDCNALEKADVLSWLLTLKP